MRVTSTKSHYQWRLVTRKTIKYVALDVHKNSISIAIADDGQEEVRYFGKIDYDFNQLDKIIRKLVSQGAILRLCR